MTFYDALVITALGMGVVFIGLILTALLISTFGLVSRMQERRAAAPETIERASAPAASGPVDDATVAVISAVLEIERRLHRADPAHRLTIVRTSETRRGR